MSALRSIARLGLGSALVALTLLAGACGGATDEDITADCGAPGCGSSSTSSSGSSSSTATGTTSPGSSATPDRSPPRSGLVGYWSFDDAAPAAHDSSGNGNDGTAQGSFTQVPGKVGLAYELDGGCIGVPDSPSLAMAGGTQVTMMAWVNAASACSSSVDNCEFMNKENTYEMAQGSGVITSQGDWSVAGGFGEAIQLNGTWAWIEQTPDVIAPGTWQHVAVTWDGSQVTRYLDGEPLDDPSNPSPMQSPPALVSSGWGLGIGCRSVAADGSLAGPYGTGVGLAEFHGIIDEAAVYDRALSPEEIAAYYAATR